MFYSRSNISNTGLWQDFYYRTSVFITFSTFIFLTLVALGVFS